MLDSLIKQESDMIAVGSIRSDGGTQARIQLDWIAIDEYSKAMQEGAQFPPIVVFHDGKDYWLADGFHRLDAAKRAGIEKIACDVRMGTVRDAILHAVGANADHGVRRTNADKRAAVMRLLEDDEWRQWSDNEIARRCRVHPSFVGKQRREHTIYIDSMEPTERTFIHPKTGKPTTMNTANIGGKSTDEKGATWKKPVRHEYKNFDVGKVVIEARQVQKPPYFFEYRTEVEISGGNGYSQNWSPDRSGIVAMAIATHYAGIEAYRWIEKQIGGMFSNEKTDERARVLMAWIETLGLRVSSAAKEDNTEEIERPPEVKTRNVHSEPAEGHIAPNINVIPGDSSKHFAEYVTKPVQLIVTSPPYNVGIDYDIAIDDLSTYIELITATWRQCYEVMEEGARICVVVPFGVGRNPWTPIAGPVMETLCEAGFTLRGQIIWDKNTTGNRTTWGSFRLPSNPSLRDTTECVVVAQKGDGTLSIPDDLRLKDGKGVHSAWLADSDYFMELAQDHWVIAPESARRIGHPAPFPVELVRRLAHFYGYPGMHIADPFGGSGTVGVAAKELECMATLMEISAEYCEKARERIYE